MLKGLVDAYRYLGNEAYLDLALKNAEFLEKYMTTKAGGLLHNHKNGKSSINGYLEDYAAVIEAYIALYEVTFELPWLTKAKALTEYCLEHFHDSGSKLFYFTQKQDDFLIRRTLETADNVIPASNSIMAKNLFRLAHHFPMEPYRGLATQMLVNLQVNFATNAQSHANWLQLALLLNLPFREVAIVGPQYAEKAGQLRQYYLPHTLFTGSLMGGTLALLKDRYVEGSTLIYICESGSCQLPIEATSVALVQLQASLKP
jgi:uncharacterized protein YyaL (SSP411 family)